MVIRQAEDAGVFKREDRFKGSFSFSHLYTGLDYEGFKRFLNLKDESAESPTPVPKARMRELGELCRWLYGSKKEGVKPLIESQNPDLSVLMGCFRRRRRSTRCGTDCLSRWPMT